MNKDYIVLIPWIQDAVDLDLPTKSNELNRLLHVNYPISQFLDARLNARDVKFLVVAPKGYGKTLVLKAKRTKLKEANDSILLLPQDSLVDRPAGTPPIFSRKAMHKKLNDLQFWKTIWITSICLSVIHTTDRDALSTIDSKVVKSINSVTIQQTPCDLFNRLLNLSDIDYFKTISSCSAMMIPLYRATRRSIAVFIDNIDGYFHPEGAERHISVDSRKGMQGDIVDFKAYVGADLVQRRQMWVLSQVGLAEAIFELRSINTQIKIFAALREEALLRGYELTSNTQQLKGISVDLHYETSELKDIFTKNIKLMSANRLDSPEEVDQIVRLFGKKNIEVTHPFALKTENIFDFMVRHSLGRPRDLMVIGEAISKINPPRSIDDIRKSVFLGARSCVLKHFQDMKSFIQVPDYMELFKIINKNVLSYEDISEISEKYNESMRVSGKYTDNHPFCGLYRLGLLGVVDRNYSDHPVQRFYYPDALPTDRTEGVLPSAKTFIIHPALDDFINELRSGDYRLNFERVNIIGDGLLWSDNRHEQFVVKGDIVKYSEIMMSPEYSAIYPRLFEEWVSIACDGVFNFCITNGDSVLMVDRSPLILIDAAKKLASKLLAFSNFSRQIRFGASSGLITFRAGPTGRTEPEGLALRNAARLEPLAMPGTILATSKFAVNAIEAGYDATEFLPLNETDLPGVDFHGGKFRVQKNESDPPMSGSLFRCPLI